HAAKLSARKRSPRLLRGTDALVHFNITDRPPNSPKFLAPNALCRKSGAIWHHSDRCDRTTVHYRYSRREQMESTPRNYSDRIKGRINPLVSKVHGKEKRWSAEYAALRQLCLASGLNEELKWGQACYDLDGRNVVLIHGFKDYCALLFMKGSLLKDPKGLLVQQTKNVQSARQIRFASLADVNKQK